MKKNLYKIITTITLFVPLPVYLFLSATLFNITPDYIVKNVEINEINIIATDDESYNFLYTDDTSVVYNGSIVYYNGKYGIYIDNDDIIKLDDGYYSYDFTNQVLKDIKEFEVQKQMSYKIPTTFFISVFGVGIVFLITQKKMLWYQKYPRLSVLITLLTVTIFLYVLNTIIGNILNVFLIATVSWALYYLEYLVNQNKIKDSQAKKIESDLINNLKEALK